jgi:light-regulated signal transduction histidine kinase (bacteriophytochrome)
MDGFGKALQTNYADKLDKKGLHYLERIRSSSQLMAGLIDDLLVLSRISRKELKKEVVYLSEIVEELLGTLQTTDKDRKVEVKIQQNVNVTGDTGLLKAMMENLLNNAWKFTHEEKLVKIDFGIIQKEGKNWIFVKDNGIGFDMKYYDKLFTPFQRLHSGDYIGSGIGLSTVQRIISKHGGQIHAESEPGKGTIFYFNI